MLVLQIISVLIVANIVVMAASVKEKSLNPKKSLIKKREAIELVESGLSEKQASLLFSAANLSRSHHYWTRKRGRTTLDPDYYYYVRRSIRSTTRPKRGEPENSDSVSESESLEVKSQLSEPTKSSSIGTSTGQPAFVEVNPSDPNVIATGVPKPHDRSKPRHAHKRFGSKL